MCALCYLVRIPNLCASVSGRTLVTFGRARCQIAAIQEAFAVTLNDTFIAFLQLCLSELDDYTTLRKKLESRRLAYDAALTKYEKMKKSKETGPCARANYWRDCRWMQPLPQTL